MVIKISNEILQKANISELKLKTEFALFLYEKNILTLEQTSKVADKDTLEFQLILGSRKIPIHYGVEDFENDLKTLKKLNRIG